MYTKLFASLVNSSLWSEDAATCKVWVTLLAMRDRGGCVFGSISGLARLTSLPVDVVDAAIAKFLSPDKYSSDLTRAPERDGRRLEVIGGGWRLLNSEYYDHLRDAEDRREQMRAASKKYREKRLQASSTVIKRHQPTSDVKSNHTLEVEVESEVDSESEKKEKRREDSSEPRGRGSEPAPIPDDLRSLTLYAQDRKLCTRWPELLAAWTVAYPGVDIVAEVSKAHSWEVANPTKRKVNRGRFLANWLSRAQDAPRTEDPKSSDRAGTGKWWEGWVPEEERTK